jgi:hypothetical protein
MKELRPCDGGHPDPTEALWSRLLQRLPFGSFRSVVAVHCRLERVHLHGLTVSAPSCWLPVLGQRRELLERAASRAMGGRPVVVHLMPCDAEPEGVDQ